MKSELLKTTLFVAAAAAIAIVAAWIEPPAYKAEVFEDQGGEFFPGFREVTAVKAIEVVDYDEAEATARPLKVELRKGRWMLASHNDYPAEAQDRLAKTAAALLDLKKQQVVSDRWEDHGTYGVIDPLDTKNPSLQGRGKRITLRDAQGMVLAELVLGGAVKDKQGYRYVRVPGQKRVYAVQTDADASARFQDWVDGNLLRLNPADIKRISVNSYSIDESMGRLTNVQRVNLTREGGTWKCEPPGKVSDAVAKGLAAALGTLRVTGARPMPAMLAEMLRTRRLAMTLESVMAMRSRGYFLTPDGRLLANEGEVVVETEKGLNYVLRFGEVVTGAAEAAKPGAAASAPLRQSEDRYLFVTVSSRNPELTAAADNLEARYADWFYVISGADFKRLRLTDQLKPAQAAAKPPAAPAPKN